MPSFTRNPASRFLCKGVNLRLPIDQIPEHQYSMLLNTRVYVDGQLTSRPGLQSLHAPFGSATYFHSLLRYVDYNPDTLVSSARFVGDDLGNLYITDSGNPITSINVATAGFSGSPLSLIAVRPEGATNAAVYVGDSTKMAEIVFRPGDTISSSVNYTVGLGPPNGLAASGGVMPIPAAGGPGNLIGTYWWRFVFRNIYTGKRSNPSAPTRQNITPDPSYGGVGLSSGLVLDGVTNGSATFTLPDQIAAGFTVEQDTIVDVYRFGGTFFQWAYVGSGPPGTPFKDDLPDLDILSAETLPVDATGAFALVQPFPVQDIYRSGTLRFSAPPGGTSPVIITLTGTLPDFNSYLPGTKIIIEDLVAPFETYAVTLFRFGQAFGSAIAEILEDTPQGLTSGVDYTFRITGAIMAGFPLPRIWGPFGAGSQGLVLFACGDPRNPGTLYWTNGNDPDSCALTNSLEITDPTEPLVNGIVWSDGRGYVWSTKRAFEIVPDFLNPGQFLARQIPGMSGLLAPWGICDCGEFIAYWGFDGIYKTQGVGSTSLTDGDLYPWFPHDTEPGEALVRGGITLNPADPAHLEKWRLSWQYGMLQVDYVEVTTGIHRTWVRGTRPDNDRGWSLDTFAVPGAVSRLSEQIQSLPSGTPPATSGTADTIVAVANQLFQFTGEDDGGVAIPLLIETPLMDVGDARASKLWGDGTLEIVTNKAGSPDMTLTLLGDPIAGGQPTGYTGFVGVPILNTGGAKQFQITSPNVLNRTLGIRISGSVAGYSPEFYSWQPSWVLKPPVTAGRIDDWTDDGKPGNKLVRGCVIEGDTGQVGGTDLSINADLKSVHSASHTFVSGDVGNHLVILSGPTGAFPDIYVVTGLTGADAVLDHSAGGASVGGITWSMGSPKTLQVQSDGGATQTTISVSHPGQSEAPYFWTPFESHEMRMSPTDSTSWEEFKIRWIYDDYPEFGIQVEDFVHLSQPLYCRGFELEASTKGLPVAFQFQGDLGTVLATPTINTRVRDILAFGFPVPIIISEYRVVPLASWEKFNLRLVGEPYPDFAAITTQHLFPANGRPAHIRGFNLRGDTQGATINLRMLGDGALLQTFPVNQLGESIPVPYVMGIPATVKVVQFVPSGSWRFWEILWDAEEYPELTTERTKVISLGGCRRVQGARIPADTQGTPVQFGVYADQEHLKVTTAPQGFQGKVTVAFPRANEWKPFFAHQVYLVPLSPARLWVDEIEWISEPAPDLATDYQTPPVTLDGTNYWTERWVWLGYISTQPVVLTVAGDAGVETYGFPSSGGVYTRQRMPLLPSKAKSRIYCVSSSEPFRLYQQDSFVLVKQWSGGGWTPLKPFGDRSLESGARI